MDRLKQWRKERQDKRDTRMETAPDMPSAAPDKKQANRFSILGLRVKQPSPSTTDVPADSPPSKIASLAKLPEETPAAVGAPSALLASIPRRTKQTAAAYPPVHPDILRVDLEDFSHGSVANTTDAVPYPAGPRPFYPPVSQDILDINPDIEETGKSNSNRIPSHTPLTTNPPSISAPPINETKEQKALHALPTLNGSDKTEPATKAPRTLFNLKRKPVGTPSTQPATHHEGSLASKLNRFFHKHTHTSASDSTTKRLIEVSRPDYSQHRLLLDIYHRSNLWYNSQRRFFDFPGAIIFRIAWHLDAWSYLALRSTCKTARQILPKSPLHKPLSGEPPPACVKQPRKYGSDFGRLPGYTPCMPILIFDEPPSLRHTSFSLKQQLSDEGPRPAVEHSTSRPESVVTVIESARKFELEAYEETGHQRDQGRDHFGWDITLPPDRPPEPKNLLDLPPAILLRISEHLPYSSQLLLKVSSRSLYNTIPHPPKASVVCTTMVHVAAVYQESVSRLPASKAKATPAKSTTFPTVKTTYSAPVWEVKKTRYVAQVRDGYDDMDNGIMSESEALAYAKVLDRQMKRSRWQQATPPVKAHESYDIWNTVAGRRY